MSARAIPRRRFMPPESACFFPKIEPDSLRLQCPMPGPTGVHLFPVPPQARRPLLALLPQIRIIWCLYPYASSLLISSGFILCTVNPLYRQSQVPSKLSTSYDNEIFACIYRKLVNTFIRNVFEYNTALPDWMVREWWYSFFIVSFFYDNWRTFWFIAIQPLPLFWQFYSAIT